MITFEYTLPRELIATHPAERRDDSRMMVLHLAEERIEHAWFRDLPQWLREGDRVVLNDARVLPSRLLADDGKTELLLLEAAGERIWRCMVRPGRRFRAGRRFDIGGVTGEVLEVLPTGQRMVRLDEAPDLERLGHMPLPPYLGRADEPQDRDRYQTVFAREPGAVAAPTAGLHFTEEMLADIPHSFVTLLVGEGTFRTMDDPDPTRHVMHCERYDIPRETVAAIEAAERVICVGTTTVRCLEASVLRHGSLTAGVGETDLCIYRPFDFRVTDALLTNFHLPRSTLLLLVCAFGGVALVEKAYREAVKEGYRFYSYGDCMLLI